MRENRVYLFTTTVAAVASIVLILSLLGLGADFGANVWPTAGTTRDDEGAPLRLPDDLAAPSAAGASVFADPVRVSVSAIGVPNVASFARLAAPRPRGRRRGLSDRGGERPRRPARRLRPRPRPVAPVAPTPAPPSIAGAARPPAPAAAPPARDDDGAPSRGGGRGGGGHSTVAGAGGGEKANWTRSEPAKPKPANSKPVRVKQAAAPPAPSRAPAHKDAKDEREGDDDHVVPPVSPGSAPSAELELGAAERKWNGKSRGHGSPGHRGKGHVRR